MYLLDSNVFIEASRTYYSDALAPGFWDWLVDQHKKCRLASVPSVRDEILDGQDGHLTRWTKRLPRTFWIEPDQRSVTSMATLSAWTMDPSRPYFDAARNDFLAKADFLLVAQAHAQRCVVVTREQPSPESKRRVLIPDACRALGVICTGPFAVYAELGLSLHV